MILLTDPRYSLTKKNLKILWKKKLLKGELNLEESNKRNKRRKEERDLKRKDPRSRRRNRKSSKDRQLSEDVSMYVRHSSLKFTNFLEEVFAIV